MFVIKYKIEVHRLKGGCGMELRKYDIIEADLFGTIGSEQGGIRPALIVQNDIGNLHSPTTIVMPFSTKIFKNPNQPTHTLIKKSADTGLKMDSVLLGEQMRVISNKRIKRKIGTVTNENEKKEIRRVYNANFGE